jgi:hypothetical protein
MKLEGYTREIWPFDRLRINGIYSRGRDRPAAIMIAVKAGVAQRR